MKPLRIRLSSNAYRTNKKIACFSRRSDLKRFGNMHRGEERGNEPVKDNVTGDLPNNEKACPE